MAGHGGGGAASRFKTPQNKPKNMKQTIKRLFSYIASAKILFVLLIITILLYTGATLYSNILVKDIIGSLGEFNSDTLEYTLYVDSYVGNVTLSGEVNDIYATVEGLGEYTLTNNVTEINIDVTAENGSVQTYKVKVVKVYKSSNNNLSLLVGTFTCHGVNVLSKSKIRHLIPLLSKLS